MREQAKGEREMTTLLLIAIALLGLYIGFIFGRAYQKYKTRDKFNQLKKVRDYISSELNELNFEIVHSGGSEKRT